MKKSLLTIAVASGLMAAGAVNAEPTVYGHAQVEVASWGGDADGTSVVDNARGRVGVKDVEDLGNGMKGLAKFEFKVDTADGDSGTAAGQGISLQKREMLVGLKGGFGQVELGRLKSAYKYYGGVTYDPFVTTVLEARGNGGMTGKEGTGSAYGHFSFISDSIAYEMKTGGISFRLTYDLDNGGGDNVTNANGANGYTAGFKFGAKDFEVILAFANDDEETSSTNGNYSSAKIGGMYDFGAGGKLSAQYESATTDTGTSVDETAMYLDYQFKMDKSNIIDVAYGNTSDDVNGTTVADVNFARVAYTHKLSKQTKTWIGYRSSDDSKCTVVTATDICKVTVIAVGLRKTF